VRRVQSGEEMLKSPPRDGNKNITAANMETKDSARVSFLGGPVASWLPARFCLPKWIRTLYTDNSKLQTN
jgi:hypothetical protein